MNENYKKIYDKLMEVGKDKMGYYLCLGKAKASLDSLLIQIPKGKVSSLLSEYLSRLQGFMDIIISLEDYKNSENKIISALESELRGLLQKELEKKEPTLKNDN